MSSQITIENGSCKLGGATTVTQFLEQAAIQNHFPNLKKHLKLVSSQQIRNMGSIAGNFVNASPIGDMSVYFLTLNTILYLIDSDQNKRQVKLIHFFKDYKTYDLNNDELIEYISFELPSKTNQFNFEKVSKRTHLDIATVNSAIHLIVNNTLIEKANISNGGVSAIPKYLTKTSDYLNNKTLSEDVLKEAEAILQSEITPISDVRGTVEYKRLLAKQLFLAHFLTLFPQLINSKTLLS